MGAPSIYNQRKVKEYDAEVEGWLETSKKVSISDIETLQIFRAELNKYVEALEEGNKKAEELNNNNAKNKEPSKDSVS